MRKLLIVLGVLIAVCGFNMSAFAADAGCVSCGKAVIGHVNLPQVQQGCSVFDFDSLPAAIDDPTHVSPNDNINFCQAGYDQMIFKVCDCGSSIIAQYLSYSESGLTRNGKVTGVRFGILTKGVYFAAPNTTTSRPDFAVAGNIPTLPDAEYWERTSAAINACQQRVDLATFPKINDKCNPGDSDVTMLTRPFSACHDTFPYLRPYRVHETDPAIPGIDDALLQKTFGVGNYYSSLTCETATMVCPDNGCVMFPSTALVMGNMAKGYQTISGVSPYAAGNPANLTIVGGVRPYDGPVNEGYEITQDDSLDQTSCWLIDVPPMKVISSEATMGETIKLKVDLVDLSSGTICAGCLPFCSCTFDIAIIGCQAGAIYFQYVLTQSSPWITGVAITNMSTATSPTATFKLIDSTGKAFTANVVMNAKIKAWVLDDVIHGGAQAFTWTPAEKPAAGPAWLCVGGFAMDGYEFVTDGNFGGSTEANGDWGACGLGM